MLTSEQENCHLIEQAKAGQLTDDVLQNDVRVTDSVHESDRFDVRMRFFRTIPPPGFHHHSPRQGAVN